MGITSALLIIKGSDAYVYDISTNRFKQISTDVSLTLGPNAGYSQKATIDPEHGEIYFFGGLIESQPYALPSNLLWLYDLVDERWSFVDSEGDGILFQPNRKTNLTKSDVPQSRFAHQFLYSASLNVIFLFQRFIFNYCRNITYLEEILVIKRICRYAWMIFGN